MFQGQGPGPSAERSAFRRGVHGSARQASAPESGRASPQRRQPQAPVRTALRGLHRGETRAIPPAALCCNTRNSGTFLTEHVPNFSSHRDCIRRPKPHRHDSVARHGRPVQSRRRIGPRSGCRIALAASPTRRWTALSPLTCPIVFVWRAGMLGQRCKARPLLKFPCAPTNAAGFPLARQSSASSAVSGQQAT
jgi:hypothetical protein